MLLELSYVVGENIPKWPTNPNEVYDKVLSMSKGDVCNANSVYHHMHNGTHVDAPRHFDPNGQTIDQLPIEDFYYNAPFLLNVPKKAGERITLTDIRNNRENIAECDILLIYTGYSKQRATNPTAYVTDFPSIAPDAAYYLRRSFPKLKAIALDVISVDDSVTAAAEGFPAHHALLEKNSRYQERTLLLYEDVNIAPLLNTQVKTICAFPVRWEGLEAAPVSMVAII
jgi:arylformamidase